MKTNFPRTLALAAVAAVLAATTLIVHEPARAGEPSAPKPDPAIQRLLTLAGTFDGDASLTMDGKTTRFRLHHENREVSAGFGLSAHETAELPGLGHYEAENLFGYDAGRGQIHLFSVTNDPNTHDHKGTWTSSNTLQLRYEGLLDGRKYVEVIPMTVVGPDEYRFKSIATLDGKPYQTLTADMKRTAMSAR